jgi:hypothetical protein
MTEAIALKSMPFDSNEVYNEATGETTFDRVAFSKDLADWMRNYFSNGILVKGSKVIADELKVTHTGGLNLSVNKGEVIINGRTGWVESAKELTVDMGGNADRIDMVVMELNVSDRYIYLKILKGTESETPEAPALTQTEDIFQIPLAQIRVNAETAVVSSVTDERPNYISNVTIGIEPPTANSAVAISVSDEVQALLGTDNVDDSFKNVYKPFNSLGIPKRDSNGAITFDNIYNIYSLDISGSGSGTMSEKIYLTEFNYTISENATELFFYGYAKETGSRGARIEAYIDDVYVGYAGNNGYEGSRYTIPNNLKGTTVTIKLYFRPNILNDKYTYTSEYDGFSIWENDRYEVI